VAQHLGVAHRGPSAVVHKVELDLQPGHPVAGLERGVVQHQSERVETSAHFPPEGDPILECKGDG
jgi:hypothetical protein